MGLDPSLLSLSDLSQEDRRILRLVRPYTMTSAARVVTLVQAVRHVSRRGIPGAVVECGVWRGGSLMAAAAALLAEGDDAREIHGYDTFDGMVPPGDEDVAHDGTTAAEQLARARPGSGVWCRAGMEEVRANLARTAYPAAHVRLVAGPVERTLPTEAPPGPIAILRLDSDWYASTRHALEHLYPRLASGGILVLDDYGHWLGARRAADEYLNALPVPPFLARVDYTGRVAVKP
jgi:hypothetical protein